MFSNKIFLVSNCDMCIFWLDHSTKTALHQKLRRYALLDWEQQKETHEQTLKSELRKCRSRHMVSSINCNVENGFILCFTPRYISDFGSKLTFFSVCCTVHSINTKYRPFRTKLYGKRTKCAINNIHMLTILSSEKIKIYLFLALIKANEKVCSRRCFCFCFWFWIRFVCHLNYIWTRFDPICSCLCVSSMTSVNNLFLFGTLAW